MKNSTKRLLNSFNNQSLSNLQNQIIKRLNEIKREKEGK